MQTILYLVRHGESEANRDETTGGNSALTEKGREQALETKQLLKDITFDAAYSSDSIRAVDTAGIIYGTEIPRTHQFKAFRERDFGKLEGEPSHVWFELMQTYEKKYQRVPFEERWGQDYGDTVENDKQMGERFLATMMEVGRANPGKTILIAAHAGPIRVMLMKFGYADWLTAGSFKNAGYVELGFDGENFQILKVVGIQEVETPHS